MENEVDIRIKIIDGASTGIAQVDNQLRKVEVSAAGAASKVKDLGSRIFSLNQMQQVFSSTRALIGQMNEVVGDLTKEWQLQLTANTQIEQVMRTRMSATEEDIAQVKRYSSELQEIGVVGDEVTLTGAQQIGTFVKHKESILALMPALDDLLVHNKGLNATSEDAMQIGNLMGKAMQGETTMLKRVGITFTEAEAQAIKFGDEQTRAATLAQVITANVGKMNEALAATDAGKAKQTAMWIGDIKEELGKVVQAAQPYLTVLGQGGMAILGATEMYKIVKELYLATNLHIGALIKDTIATVTHTVATSADASAQLAHNASLTASNPIMVMHRTLLNALTVATGSATAATVALTAAYTMGLSLVIMGLVSLYNEFVGKQQEQSTAEQEAAEKAKEDAEKVASAKKSEQEAYANARSEMEANIAKLKEFHGNKVAEKKLVDELNSKYGETLGTYSSVAAWYKVMTTNSEAYCRQLENEVVMRNLANQAAEIDMKIESYRGKRYSKAKPSVYNADDGTTTYGKSDWDRANDAIAQLNKQLDDTRTRMRSAAAEGQKFSDILNKGVAGVPLAGEKKGSKTTTKKNGKDDLPVSNPLTYKELGDAISYYQDKLEATKPTETAVIEALGKKISGYKQAQAAAKDAIETAQGEGANEVTLNGINKLIAQQEELRGRATVSDLANIDKEIERLNGLRTALESSTKPLQTASQVSTYDELDKALQRWYERLQKASASERIEISKNIKALNELRTAWDEATETPPSAAEQLRTMKELGDAVSYYQHKVQTQSGAELRDTQQTLSALEKKQSVMERLSKIGLDDEPLGAKGLKGTDLTDELSKYEQKLKDVKQLLRDMQSNGMSGVTQQDLHRVKQLGENYSSYIAQLKKSQLSAQGMWSVTRGLGNSMQSMSDALKSNEKGWRKFVSVIDAAFNIYNSISDVIALVKLLTTSSTAAKSVEATVTAGASATNVTAASADVAASATRVAAAKIEEGAWASLAAAKTFAAYAGIPFVGFGLASGEIAAQQFAIRAAAIPAFADGGVVYGPTVGLIGEYAGATANPEVIAPLDKLKSLIGGGGGIGGKVEFKIKGRELYGILKKEGNLIDRS